MGMNIFGIGMDFFVSEKSEYYYLLLIWVSDLINTKGEYSHCLSSET